MSSRFSFSSSLWLAALITLASGCEDITNESVATAPPDGHCEQLCNHLDEVNQELRCDEDTEGLGETYEVDVAACVAECNEPFVCMDLIVAYDQCRIGLSADQFFCSSRRDSPPLQNECTAEQSEAFDCQSDNL